MFIVFNCQAVLKIIYDNLWTIVACATSWERWPLAIYACFAGSAGARLLAQAYFHIMLINSICGRPWIYGMFLQLTHFVGQLLEYFSSLGSSRVFCSERPSPRNSRWHDPELFRPSACCSACPCAALVAFITLFSIPKVLANQFHSQRKGVTPSILWHFHLRNILSPFLSQLWADQLVT